MEFLYQKHNPWWENPKNIEEDIDILGFEGQPFKYRHPLLAKIPGQSGVIVIRGPRRIGKTTLIKLVIRELLTKQKRPARKIFFYPCNRIVDFNQLFDLLAGYLGKNDKKYPRFLFLDEVTFVHEWQRAVKDLWDSGDLQNTILILTGSNALDLKFSSERLPGRRGNLEMRDIEYGPLRFFEFVGMTGKKRPLTTRINDFLLCGGFPQSINEYYAKGFISNSIYEDYLGWIEGDIHKAGKSEKLMYAIFGEMFKHLGSTTSWYAMAKDSGITSHSTVCDYMDILEKLFVTFTIHYYSVNQKKVYLNKNKKLYFTDPMIFHAIRAKVDGFTDQFFRYSKENSSNPQILPGLIENAVGSQLLSRYGKLYYGEYNGKEVDFVAHSKARDLFFEVKFQKEIKVSGFDYWGHKQPLRIITPDFSLKKGNLVFEALENFLERSPVVIA